MGGQCTLWANRIPFLAVPVIKKRGGLILYFFQKIGWVNFDQPTHPLPPALHNNYGTISKHIFDIAFDFFGNLTILPPKLRDFRD